MSFMLLQGSAVGNLLGAAEAEAVARNRQLHQLQRQAEPVLAN